MVDRSIVADVENIIGVDLPLAIKEGFLYALTAPRIRQVRSIAEHVDLSPEHFARICKCAELPSPKAWLVLAHAVHLSALLHANPREPFSRIACELGYPDQYGLSRAISKCLGWRPRDFRKEPADGAIVEQWWTFWSARLSKHRGVQMS